MIQSSTAYILFALLSLVLFVVLYTTYHLVLAPLFSPLHNLPGPPASGRLGTHLHLLLDAEVSAQETERLVKQYGPSFRIQGMGAHDERLMTVDPLAISHVLNRSTIYEKPWQSRRLITRLIGEGMLASEGNLHKRQRKVCNPAFSHQNLCALMPVFLQKAEELRDKWSSLMTHHTQSIKIDVCSWIGRTTFDIIGLAGFGYSFRALHEETNEAYLAYRDMFEIVFSHTQGWKIILGIYFPLIHSIWPDEKTRVTEKSREIIYRVGRKLVQDKKKQLLDEDETRHSKDLLTLLLKSNISKEIPENQRMSDDEILNQISTFLFAGSDTSALTLTWTLYFLAKHPEIQARLRAELRNVHTDLTDSWVTVDDGSQVSSSDSKCHSNLLSRLEALPLLDCVLRESLRLTPAIHSSIRVATKDDEIPFSDPITMRDGTKQSSVRIKKGQFVHVAIEGFNLDRDVWGGTGWVFDPDRWLDLPEKAKQRPGIYPNVLTFSAGPRSCIGMMFAIIEMKVILYTLLSSFDFSEPEDIVKSNVVLTRPFVRGRYKDGSQCPMTVRPC
ncbi:cytochrome-450 hydroxylase [Ramaria rubella]|nr:cytochrome-450 hydroxylase [Ramaria rubella]